MLVLNISPNEETETIDDIIVYVWSQHDGGNVDNEQ